VVETKDPAPANDVPARSDAANWAHPVDRLSAAGVGGNRDDTVTGKRVSGPLQGFGQLWQKTFSVRLDGTEVTPAALIATWKEHFPEFWPNGQQFYGPLSGIAPGEVALLEIRPLPGAPVKLSTGVLVVYADDESFTFITPEGHTLSGWITFSARRVDDVTIAQVEALERPSDPFDELAYMLVGNNQNNKFWQGTMRNPRAFGRGRGAGRRNDDGVHRQESSMALLAECPEQRDHPLRTADHHRARADADRAPVERRVP